MNTNEKIEKIQKEQRIISDNILKSYEEYGWKFGAAHQSDIFGACDDGYTMKIEDGQCPDVIEALTVVFCNGSVVFEGRLETPDEVPVLMKMLGFKKIEVDNDDFFTS